MAAKKHKAMFSLLLLVFLLLCIPPAGWAQGRIKIKNDTPEEKLDVSSPDCSGAG